MWPAGWRDRPLVGHRDQTRLPGIVAGLDGVDSSTRGVSLREVAKRLSKTRVSHSRTNGRTGALTLLAPRCNGVTRSHKLRRLGRCSGTGSRMPQTLTASRLEPFQRRSIRAFRTDASSLAIRTLALGTGVGVVGLTLIIVMIVLIIRIL